MQPLTLTLKGFRGIRDGLGLSELTLDVERLAGDAQLIAIAGPNGSGKTTVMDNLTPYNVLASRAAVGGPGGFSYYDHVYLPESMKDLVWAHEGRSYRSQIVIRLNCTGPDFSGHGFGVEPCQEKGVGNAEGEGCRGGCAGLAGRSA
jgi:exonuclease SbcC